MIKKNYELCLNKYQLQQDESIEKDNKYVNISNVITIMKKHNLIKEDILENIVLDIVLEDIEYNNRINLINYLINNTLSDFNQAVLKYYQSKFIKNLDPSITNLVYILPVVSQFDKYKYTLYCLKTLESKQELILAEYEDYNEFDNTIKSLLIPKTEFNHVFAFMVLNKKLPKDFIIQLKVKTGENSGAKCNQAQKRITEKIFKDIGLPDKDINLFIKFRQQIFCYAQEIYFRYFNLIKKNDKIWFLDSIMAYLNNLS